MAKMYPPPAANNLFDDGEEATLVHQFESGAVRSSDGDDMRLDLLCPTALMRIARIYKEGADKYDKNGVPNWTKGIPIRNIIGHAIHHLMKYQAYDRTEDHLAKVCWGLMAIMHYQTHCEHDKTVVEFLNTDVEYREFRKRQPVPDPPGLKNTDIDR